MSKLKLQQNNNNKTNLYVVSIWKLLDRLLFQKQVMRFIG